VTTNSNWAKGTYFIYYIYFIYYTLLYIVRVYVIYGLYVILTHSIYMNPPQGICARVTPSSPRRATLTPITRTTGMYMCHHSLCTCVLNPMFCILYTIHCTHTHYKTHSLLYTNTTCTIHYTLYTIHYTLYTIHYTLYTIR
jgi:hypothetical protein